jgi:hypothetical protein
VWEALQTQADEGGDLEWLRGARWNHTFPAIEPPDRAIGRSRGGLTTKIHLGCDGQGRPMSLWLTAGNVNDVTELPVVLAGIRVPRPGAGRPRIRPDVVVADKGYSSRANRRPALRVVGTGPSERAAFTPCTRSATSSEAVPANRRGIRRRRTG